MDFLDASAGETGDASRAATSGSGDSVGTEAGGTENGIAEVLVGEETDSVALLVSAFTADDTDLADDAVPTPEDVGFAEGDLAGEDATGSFGKGGNSWSSTILESSLLSTGAVCFAAAFAREEGIFGVGVASSMSIPTGLRVCRYVSISSRVISKKPG